MMKYDFTPLIPNAVTVVSTTMNRHGIPNYLIGGVVRDMVGEAEGIDFFSTDNLKDWDLECYAESNDALARAIRDIPGITYKLVGSTFPIMKAKLNGLEFDLALPRTEYPTGDGHKDFGGEIIGNYDLRLASQRRDFTINSMMYHIPTMELIDHHGGRIDLIERKLRQVSGAFEDDQLRVMRAAKFISRFGLACTNELYERCAAMSLNALSKERLYWEWVGILDGKFIHKALRFLQITGHLNRTFPELEDLVGVEQDPKHHPEGDAFTHTCMVTEKCARYGHPMWMRFAALCHDMGKTTTTVKRRKEDGSWQWTSWGHDEAGIVPAERFMQRICDDTGLIRMVCLMTRHHMAIVSFDFDIPKPGHKEPSDKWLRKLSARIAPLTLEELIKFTHIDKAGRHGANHYNLSLGFNYYMNRANELFISSGAPKRLVTGKDLIENGFGPPGPELGRLLDLTYEAQLDDKFNTKEEGLKWIDKPPSSA